MALKRKIFLFVKQILSRYTDSGKNIERKNSTNPTRSRRSGWWLGLAFSGGIVCTLLMAVAPGSRVLQTETDSLLAIQKMLADQMPAVVQVQLIKTTHRAFGPDQLQDYFLPENLEVQNGNMFNEREVGAGFVFRSGGYIVTARHLMTNMDVVEVVLQDGERLEAEVVGSDLRSNVAVLRVKKDNLPAIDLDLNGPDQPGQLVFAIGSPMASEFRNSVTQGVLSAVGTRAFDEPALPAFGASYWLVDAAMNPGNSGGPVLDRLGRLVGMASVPISGHRSTTGLHAIVPASRVLNSVHTILARGSEGQARLGIQYGPVSTSLVQRGGAAEIVEVEPGSSAFEAGLQRGDIILAINDAVLENLLDLSEEMERHRPGDVITLTIQRGEDAIRMQIRLKGKKIRARGDTSVQVSEDVVLTKLGLVLDDLTRALMFDLEVPVQNGAVVLFVDPASVAFREGEIRSGMVIVEAGGQPVSSKPDFMRIYNETPDGEVIRIKFYRPHTTDPVMGALRKEE